MQDEVGRRAFEKSDKQNHDILNLVIDKSLDQKSKNYVENIGDILKYQIPANQDQPQGASSPNKALGQFYPAPLNHEMKSQGEMNQHSPSGVEIQKMIMPIISPDTEQNYQRMAPYQNPP